MKAKATGNPDPRGALARGRAAYAQRDWDDAYAALAAADQASPLKPADLQLLAWSAGLTGRDQEFLGLQERLYQVHLDAGDAVPAARAALWMINRLFSLGEAGRAGAWLARAQRLLEQDGRDCAEQGYLLMPSAQRQIAEGNRAAACDIAARAAQIGEHFGDRDLVALARNLQGRALIGQGQLPAGLAMVDDAMLAATTGELSPIVTGIIYCSAIAGCQQAYAHDRAREWTAALARWCQEQPQLVSFSSRCLVHRSEVMQLGGAWPEAIEEARRAADCLAGSDAGAGGDAFYQQAEIHRLRGEVAAAEEAYRRASALGCEPHPGLALLRLAQGQTDAAASGIRRAVSTTTEPLPRTRLLPAYVEIMLAAGDREEARRACQELQAIAARIDSDVIAAIAAHARGAVALSDGDAAAALPPLRQAFAVWQQVGAPYLAARLRVLIGHGCRALGDDEGAALELEAARAVFERLGAAPDLAGFDQGGQQGQEGKEGKEGKEGEGAPARHPDGLTARELQVLRLVATGKTNRAIARELFLSEKTVDRHVSNIFTKISVPSRAAATAYAYQHKLV